MFRARAAACIVALSLTTAPVFAVNFVFQTSRKAVDWLGASIQEATGSRSVSGNSSPYGIVEMLDNDMTYSASPSQAVMFRCSAFSSVTIAWLPSDYIAQDMGWSGSAKPGDQQSQVLADGRTSVATFLGTIDSCGDSGCYMASTLAMTTPVHGDSNNATTVICTVADAHGHQDYPLSQCSPDPCPRSSHSSSDSLS